MLSIWLERLGIAALHASAVVVERQAMAFLSNSGGGKSTLAGAMLQSGFPLLTDDILPIEQSGNFFLGRPGFPSMRLWPQEAQYFLGSLAGLDPVYPGTEKRRVDIGPGGFGDFCNVSVPIKCLYLPERNRLSERNTSIEIRPLSPLEGVIALVRHSFAPRIVEVLGWQPRRLDLFTQLIQQVPIRYLRYPSGFEHLPRVRDAILEDLAELG
ncbi:MAG: hypothetical protein EXR62_11905 [Chloroflexi bacterium]|nr:hypothetical protein [Chloroflexota bacterium]